MYDLNNFFFFHSIDSNNWWQLPNGLISGCFYFFRFFKKTYFFSPRYFFPDLLQATLAWVNCDFHLKLRFSMEFSSCTDNLLTENRIFSIEILMMICCCCCCSCLLTIELYFCFMCVSYLFFSEILMGIFSMKFSPYNETRCVRSKALFTYVRLWLWTQTKMSFSLSKENKFVCTHTSMQFGPCMCVLCMIVYVYMPSSELIEEMTKYMVQWLRCIELRTHSNTRSTQ